MSSRADDAMQRARQRGTIRSVVQGIERLLDGIKLHTRDANHAALVAGERRGTLGILATVVDHSALARRELTVPRAASGSATQLG